MTKIKDFRKNINFIEWESRYLLQIVRDLEEHYKDLQLTRVTRNLQEILEVFANKTIIAIDTELKSDDQYLYICGIFQK